MIARMGLFCRFVSVALGAALLAGATGCVETSVYERTASRLEQATRAAQQKDQQIRALEWQVVTLAQQLREAQAREAAARRELSAQVQQLTAANAALGERVKKHEEESARPPLPFPGDEKHAGPADRRRTEDLRRMVVALAAQSTRLMERLARLEQKIDAQAAEAHGRPKPARPERTADGDIVDPWGFGARK